MKVQILPSPLFGGPEFPAKERHDRTQDGELRLELIDALGIQHRRARFIQAAAR